MNAITNSVRNFSFFTHLRNWYARFERPISSLSLVSGFVFDALTLTRVDRFWENLWVGAHLFIVAGCIVWIHTLENEGGDEKNPARVHFWLVNVLQFFFGGLLSTFLVFYFRSSDIAVSWPFILILTIAFVANERLKNHFARLTFQVSLFFLSLFSFAIFIIPVLIHKIGRDVFVWSGVISIVLIAIFLFILFCAHRKKYQESAFRVYLSVIGIFVLINSLYFAHFLPPIPLSLKDAGIYHSLERNSNGNYIAGYENIGWRGFITLYPTFHSRVNEKIYAYSAVFSPSSLNTTIIHEWQYFDTQSKKWETSSTVALPVIGGRERGFRTFSTNSDLKAGQWRVNVKTSTNEVIGRIRFTIIPVDFIPQISQSIHT